MTRDDIKNAVSEALEEKLGDFFIEREQHFQDHQFISGVREGISTVRRASLWTLGVAIFGAIGYAIKTALQGVATR